MIYCRSLVVSALAVSGLGLATLLGCSSAEDSAPSGTGGTASGGSAATSGGSTAAVGGSSAGGSATTGGVSAASGGATAATGGASSTSGGSSATGGGSGTAQCVAPKVQGPECRGISSNMACGASSPEGTACTELVCGLADSGRRSCTCTGGIWMCTLCDYANSPFKNAPANPVTCTSQAKTLPCTMLGDVCTGAAGGQACACWYDDECAPTWDCDKPPTSWTAAQ